MLDSSFFTVSPDERTAGRFQAVKTDAIKKQIADQGYAIVGPLVSEESCTLLSEAILADAQRVRALNRPTRHELHTATGHLQLGLPRSDPFVRADLIANPLIEHIVAEVLGEDAWLGFYNGNVNMPGSGFQKVHFDRPFSWRTEEEALADGQPWPPPTTTLSCSVALAGITEANGATEIYPGSHRETAVAVWPVGERVSDHPEVLELWQPPVRMQIPAGAVCFRDPRMWHRGVPNTGALPRPMIALTYHAAKCLHWRGRLVRNLSSSDQRACRANPELKVMDDGTLADARLIFDESAQHVFAATNYSHAINRNARFVELPARVNHFLDAHEVGGARLSLDGVVGPHV